MPGIARGVARSAATIARLAIAFRYLVIALALVATVLVGRYTVAEVGINTDTAEMLDEALPWRRAYQDFTAAFPWFSDNIVIVIDADTPDLADASATELAASLRQHEQQFAEIFYPGAMPFFQRNQLLYLDTGALENLATSLSGAQAMLGQLARDPGLNGLSDLLARVVAQTPDTVPPTAGAFLNTIAATIDDFLAGDRTPMSWTQLLAGDGADQQRRAVIVVQPRLDYSSPLPASEAIAMLGKTLVALDLDDHPAVRVRRTGAAALGHDELSSVIRGAEQAAFAAALMIAACLLIGLRSPWLVLATLVSLVVGLVATAGFATAAVGTLNMISVAFAALYVGLGVDFAIHLCLRYRELAASATKRTAIVEAVQHIGPSLALCALTTAIAFFAFLPTAYRGVAELGLISGVGMAISLVVSFTLLPALLAVLPAPRYPRAAARMPLLPTSRPRPVIAGAVLLAVIALAIVPRAHFDINPLRLNDQAAESVILFDDLAARSGESLYALSVVARDAAHARQLRDAMARNPVVGGALTAADLVAADQAEKLAIIDDLRWTLGPDLVVGDASDIDAGSNSRLAALNDAAADSPVDGAAALAGALTRLATVLEALPAAEQRPRLRALEQQLMQYFPAQIERLAGALEAEEFGLDDLPVALARRWIAADGRWRVEIQPAEDLDRRSEVDAFVAAVRATTGPAATGIPVINLEAANAVTSAFVQAFATALVAIAALLWIIYRRVADVLAVLAPLLLAGLLTTAICVLIGQPFNFANIIALPLLMGIGVDSALHIHHRHTSRVNDTRPLLQTSTARAVLFSALTTAASFGNLALSPHAGTASMGLMLTIGLAMMLLTTLVVLPALLARFVARSESPV